MYSYFWLTVVLLALPAFGAPGATEELRPPATAALAEASVQLGGRPPLLPPLPAPPPDVSDLTFQEFFGPIGDRGLEYSERFRARHGQRVRIVGYMVRQEVPTSGLFLLTPTPQATHEMDYALCDDLPPTTLHVIVPARADRVVVHVPGPIAVTGRLEVGPHPEADGRNSVARLILDEPVTGHPRSAPAGGQ